MCPLQSGKMCPLWRPFKLFKPTVWVKMSVMERLIKPTRVNVSVMERLFKPTVWVNVRYGEAI